MAPTPEDLILNFGAEAITQEQVDPLIKDYTSEKFTSGLNDRQNAFREQVVELFKSPETIQQANADLLVGQLIRQGNQVGGVDDIVARASRDILRLKGQTLGDQGIDEVFAAYKIKSPPLDDIKFLGYDSLDDEHEKVDGWAAQAKAAYNLKTKADHPELLAHRDEVFQKIDDTAVGLKKKVGATDSAFVDFVGRLAEGGASVFDSVGLDGVGNFIRKHSATNPEWDSDVSSIVGQALGQGVTMLAAAAAASTGVGALAGAAGAAAGTATAIGTGAAVAGVGISNLNATQDEREKKVMQATGSEGLADAASSIFSSSALAEAGIDTLIDVSTLGLGKLGAGKVVKKLVGGPGRAFLSEGFAESLGRTAGKLDNLKKTAGLAGDVIWNGTKEGATEALQGAISDTSVGKYTNMKDKFDPFDIRNRAADFIGGVAGGVGITLANNYLLPGNRLPPPPAEETKINYDERLRRSGAAFSSADNVDRAANSATDFVQTAAAAQTQDILSGEQIEIPPIPDISVALTDKFDYRNMYENTKQSLGDMINHPSVQEHLEAGLDLFNKVRAYIPAARPKDVAPAATTAEPVVAPVASTEPVVAPVASAEAAAAVPIAEAQVADVTTPPEAVISTFEDALKAFPTTDVQSLDGGGSRYNFSLAPKGNDKNEVRQAVKEGKIELVDEEGGEKRGTQVIGKSGSGLRLDRNQYSVEMDAEGNPTSFKTTRADGTITIDSSVNTKERLAERTQGIINSQKITTDNAQIRAKKEVTSKPHLRSTLPENIKGLLPPSIQNFVSNALRPSANNKGGGKPAEDFARADAYLDDGRAYEDLIAGGVTSEQASDYLSSVRGLSNSEFRPKNGPDGKSNPKRNIRLEKFGEIELALAKNFVEPGALESAVNEGYAPAKRQAILKEVFSDQFTKNPKTRQATRVKPAPVEAPPKVSPATKPTKPQLSDNEDLQRMAAENEFGSNAEAVLKLAKTSKEYADLLRDTTDNYLAGYDDVDLDGTPEQAIEKIDNAFNRGAFKSETATPNPTGLADRSLFSLNRIAKLLGLKTDVAPSIASQAAPSLDGPTGRQTGVFDPRESQITLATPLLRSPGQSTQVLLHEIAEKSISDTPDAQLVQNLAVQQGAQQEQIAAEAKQVSDDIRLENTSDTHEHLVDAVSRYLKDPAAFTKSYPTLGAAIQSYIQTSPNTELAKAAGVFASEDAIPVQEKLLQFAKEQALAAAKSTSALASVNLDKRTPLQKIKDAINSAHVFALNASVNLEKIADQLEKAGPTYSPMAKTFRNYLQVFKNRRQTAEILAKALRNSFENTLVPIGVTIDHVNNFLSNNDILNNRAFWEQTLANAGMTGEQLGVLFDASPTIQSLLDPSLQAILPARDSTPVDVESLLPLLNELGAKAYGQAKEAVIQNELLQAPGNKRLRHALSAAFDPLVLSRGTIANAGLIDRQTAQTALDTLRSQLSPEQYAALENFSQNSVAPVVRQAIRERAASGAMTKDAAQFYLGNADSYVTFQMSDAIATNPYVDASLRKREGMIDDRAGVFESTLLKTTSIIATSKVQNLANAIGGLYYAYDSNSGQTIRPIAYTSTNGIGKNKWVRQHPIPNSSPFYANVRIEDTPEGKQSNVNKTIFETKTLLEKQNKDKGYFVTAQDGDYVLHEVDDPSVNNVLHPKTVGDQSEFIQQANKLQNIARMWYTSNNLYFAARSVVRLGSNLAKNTKSTNAQGVPSFLALAKDTLAAPILGIPLNAQHRSLVFNNLREARAYTARQSTSTGAIDTLGQSFDENTTVQDLMSDLPRAYEIAARQGDLPVSLGEDLSSGETREVVGKSLLLSSNQLGPETDDIFHGQRDTRTVGERLSTDPTRQGQVDYVVNKAKQFADDQILQRAHNYLGPKNSVRVSDAANFIGNTFQKIRDLNNSIELAEKMVGIISYMQEGDSYPVAVQKANKNFGNPDARGGGAGKATLAPFSLYTTSMLNSLRVIGDISKGAIDTVATGASSTLKNGVAAGAKDFAKAAKENLVTKDQRLLKASAMGVRNQLALASLPLLVGTVISALGDDDDTAEDGREVIRRMVTNIPETDRRSGMAVPLFFRDPRTGEHFYPGVDITNPAQIDPSWTTVYINAPYDQSTAVFTGILAPLFDSLNARELQPGIVANMLGNFLGQVAPSLGPLANTGIAAIQAARGVNPTNQFTGRPIVDDDTFNEGGVGLAATYLQYFANQFIPPISAPGKRDNGKTSLQDPNILSTAHIARILTLGTIKDSNFGQIQNNRGAEQNLDSFQQKIQADTPSEVKQYLDRSNELQREAVRRLRVEKGKLLDQGVSPKTANLRSAELLPPQMRDELIKSQVWRREFYDRLREKAEIALRSGANSDYEGFLADLRSSIPET